MSREEQRILAGSLNLLPPSDKTPENDALDLFNFRVDQAGVLRGGDTFALLAGPFAGGAVHTIVRLTDMGTVTYINAGTADLLFYPWSFLVGAGPNLYLSVSGAITLLASGFDGNPLSIVAWNGFLWVMNKAKRICLYPLGIVDGPPLQRVLSWVPDPPAVACTAVADTGPGGGPVGTYTYYTTFTGIPTAGPNTPVESGASPGMTVTAAAGVVSITGLPAQSQMAGSLQPNGSYGGGQSFVSGAYIITAVNLYRSGGTLSGTRLVQVFGSTGDYIEPNFPSLTFPYTDSKADSVIASAPTIPSGSGSVPAAPTSAPAVVGGPVLSSTYVPVGTYQYYVTFVSINGLETNPGPASQPVTDIDGAIDLSGIPVSSDPAVYARRIYRTGGSLGQAYQVTQIADNTTTTYIDRANDLSLTQLGIVMPTTNDPPPAALGLVGPYFNRLLAFDGNRFYWSQDGVPLFPGSQPSSSSGNWDNVGQPDDHIYSITLHSRVAIFHKQRSIWRLVGDVVEGYLEQTSAAIGAGGRNAVANAGAIDLVLNSDGLWNFNLDAESKASQKLDPIFLGTAGAWTVLGASDLTGYTWNPVQPVCAYLSGTALLSDGNGTAFLYHLATQRFAAIQAFPAVAITAVCSLSSAWDYFIGTSDGKLYGASQVPVTAQTYIWQTRFLDQGLADQQKVYDQIVLDWELHGCFATVYVLYDNSAAGGALSTQELGLFTGTTRVKRYIDLQPEGANPTAYPHISVRIVISGSIAEAVAPAIHGLYVYWSAEPRDAANIDTQVIDFHSDNISLARKVAVNVLGEVYLTISTDEPGGLATRYQKLVGAENVRQWVKFNLPPGIRGRLWRIQAESIGSPGLSRLYSIRAWMRKTGTAGEESWGWVDWIEGNPPIGVPDAA